MILAVNGTPITSPAHMKEQLPKAHNHIAFLLQRDESKIYVPIDLG